ncbi:hypothetical protein TPHA_0F02260 [Tetrapisispora phaffii CBS 4417]|uniref:Fumarylacetoacetase-like C-terminal domain-containing protein n=1 Tax=Tetrapisispora phaffii (strain ATCC 24235 / CBS 4417 / NBRC 1672 / NRRL Y-8282 / UCD 70-5) TaxID=1071381 RepID=G8BUC1_TETPH|nr:hypothetical protein TPHA_0F02260 [Tetrapisispora phaffii CBS 4417]CCE63707.1 hypothetical protein TPHA_0F02260 [Tetrapisispora phaffii CBS 4417]
MSYQYLKAAPKVICIGRNFAAHIQELNSATPKQPFFFLKPKSAIITQFSKHLPKEDQLRISGDESFHGLNENGTNPGHILLPNGTEVHHEIEVALVMNKYLSNVSEANFKASDVYDSISGIALALDLTARNVQAEAKKKGLPWSIPKGFDTFLPMSQFINKDILTAHKDNLQDVFNLKCSVNGELRQNASSDLMLVTFHKIIQHISTKITLEPGDIILTGTPAGVGQLNPGDHISGELFYNGKKIINMEFDCLQRPGPFVYRET